MIILFALILFVSLVLALKKPSIFVVFYILASTKFLGFFSLGVFVFGGTDLGFFSLNIITLVAAFTSKSATKISKFILPMYCVIACLFLWGILNPVLNHYESVIQALVASKDFLYFSILFYLFGRKNSIDVRVIVRFLRFLGCYLTIVLFLSVISSVSPPFYSESYELLSGGYKDYVRVYFPTYISLSLFVFYADWLQKKISTKVFVVILVFFFVALLMAGHFALTLGSLFSIVGIYVLWHRKRTLNIKHIVKVSTALLVVIGGVLVCSEKTRLIVVEFSSAVVDGSDISLSSRERYNKFRWDAINQKPYMGYGFIHQDAAIMSTFETSRTNRFMMRLGVIDSGYIDMLVRFGYVGMLSYLSIFSFYLVKVCRYSVRPYYSLGMGAFLFQYFLVNYTWSVFTYAHGIIPMSIALYILYCSEKKFLE